MGQGKTCYNNMESELNLHDLGIIRRVLEQQHYTHRDPITQKQPIIYAEQIRKLKLLETKLSISMLPIDYTQIETRIISTMTGRIKHVPKSTYEFSSEQELTLKIPLIIKYNISKGYPDSPPSHSCGGEPGMPDEIEDMLIDVDHPELVKLILSINDSPEDYGIDEGELLTEASEEHAANLAVAEEAHYDSLHDR